MSLDKAIEHGKEHRKPYRRLAQQIDPSCRNHGGCEWCEGNRKYKYNKKIEKMEQQEKEYVNGE